MSCLLTDLSSHRNVSLPYKRTPTHFLFLNPLAPFSLPQPIHIFKTKTESEMNSQKTVPEVGIQIPEEGKLSLDVKSQYNRKADMARASLRLVCLFSSVIALSFMVTSKQSATISIYGFNLPVYSKWSFSSSFEYLVGISAAAAAHSLLQLAVSVVKLVNKTPVFPSRYHAWLVFACDQIFAYALMSAGAAASGVTNLNRTGIKHSALPNFCKPLRHFCDQVAVSITFTFFSCFLVATSAVLDVIWLSKN